MWIGDAWYGFNWDGTMCTGWVWDSYYVAWYWCDPRDGHVATRGWTWVDGAWYYFYDSGQMAKSKVIDGYWINASGTWGV